jgi:hydrogenase maturation factor
MYVYIYPAQTDKNIYPLGGDIRYLISPDGSTIVEKRQLHKTILYFRSAGNSLQKVVAGTHSHILSDVPEDTDVFYVLTRKPSIPEYIGAGKHVFKIHVDGTIELQK